jgi:hypothetical protein
MLYREVTDAYNIFMKYDNNEISSKAFEIFINTPFQKLDLFSGIRCMKRTFIRLGPLERASPNHWIQWVQ